MDASPGAFEMSAVVLRPSSDADLGAVSCVYAWNAEHGTGTFEIDTPDATGRRALGFTPVGPMRAAGWKFDRWLDVVVMQKSLGFGASLPAT